MTATAKITKVGNSSAMIIPKEIMEQLQLAQGDSVTITQTANGIEVAPYDSEFVADMNLAEKIMREDRDVLHKLAQ